MINIHRQFFTLHMMELDGIQLSPSQRAELKGHLSSCPACRIDILLHQRLQETAGFQWQAKAPKYNMEKVLHGKHKTTQLQWLALPLRAMFWIGIALLAFVVVEWIYSALLHAPAVLPPGLPTSIRHPQEDTRIPSEIQIEKIVGEPVLQGETLRSGIWSPSGDTLFQPVLDVPSPGSDRRTTSLHFISAASGEDCPATQTFLGNQGLQQNYAWLDDERVLFIDKFGKVFLFTRCQPGSQDLSDRFSEPLVRVVAPLISLELARPGPLLLEAPSAFWLLDPVTLEARPLDEPVPSSNLDPAYLQTWTQQDPIPTLNLIDSFAWLPSGRQLSIIHPLLDDPNHSRLVVLDLDSGEIQRTVDLEINSASSDNPALLVEWMGPQRPFIWAFDSGGPMLVDLSQDPPQQVRVLPELFGINMAYPDQISSMGVFYSSTQDTFHIVAHINLPEDKSIYLYHSENGQVEKLEGNRQVMMVLPDDELMPMIPVDSMPSYNDGFDLIWVDRPDIPASRLQISGHTPRNYDRLQTRLLPGSQQMLVSSSQGISLIGLPGGEILKFWQLSRVEEAILSTFSLSPDGRTVIATAHMNPTGSNPAPSNYLYWFQLDP